MVVTGDDRDAGVGEHCREVVHQAMGERWAVAAGDEVYRLLDPERQLLVEVPPDERRYLPEEAVAAVPFGTFQTLPAQLGLDHSAVLRSAERGQERVEGGGQVTLVGGAHRRAQCGTDEGGHRRPVV